MTLRTVLLSCALAFSFGVAPVHPAPRPTRKARVAPAAVDLSGRWVYNRELSRRRAEEDARGPG